MGKKPVRVYCAGPLFNAKEREEMKEIATAIEKEGYPTFLPQRDGLELAVCAQALVERGLDQEKASSLLSRAIFALDVYQLLDECQAAVVNLNGRVPDEGAVSEAAIAWCEGKALIGYKADYRSVFLGKDNPLVVGLFGFRLCEDTEEIVSSLRVALAKHKSQEERKASRRTQLKPYLNLGEKIWAAMHGGNKVDKVASLLAQEGAAV
jgi:nucleoside 2-deoxyribosyltransferase